MNGLLGDLLLLRYIGGNLLVGGDRDRFLQAARGDTLLLLLRSLRGGEGVHKYGFGDADRLRSPLFLKPT